MISTKIIVVGSINWDTILFAEQFPIPGEVRIEKIKEVPGGKGANISIASSRILGSNTVAIFGVLGRDNIAKKKQVHILENEGVVTNMLYFTRNIPSGREYIVVDAKGRNVILTYKHTNDILSEKVINSRMFINILTIQI
jgi:sugar/nucleoside kinase (ribokinase family)